MDGRGGSVPFRTGSQARGDRRCREIARRAREAVAGLPAGLVFAGFSLGAVHAEVLAASRPGALGVVLMHGAVPVEDLSEYFGVDRWPEGVPVQVHYAASDPWVEAEEEVVPLGDAVRGAGAEFEAHAYPGSGHLFTDPDLPEYDRASSEQMWERVLAFLARIDASVPVVEVHPVSESIIIESTPFKDFRD